MKAFVTGGTGFVGSHLVDALLAHGHEVTCLVRDPDKLARRFPGAAPRAVRGTLADGAALRDGMRGADVVYHVAGLTAAVHARHFFAVNAEATASVVAAARDAAPNLTRFVYVSSLAAAGPSLPGQPRVETDVPRPVSAYGRSKLAGEHAVRDSTLPWTIVRPPAVFGPHDREMHTVFRLVRWGVVPLAGSPAQELSLIHVADLADALLAVLTPAARDGLFFAANPEIVTAQLLLERIAAAVRDACGDGRPRRLRVIPLPTWLARAALGGIGWGAAVMRRATVLSADKANELLAHAWTCSPERLERATGWHPRLALAAGLHDTARWYRTHGWL